MNDVEKKKLENDILEVCGIIGEEPKCFHENGVDYPEGGFYCPDCGMDFIPYDAELDLDTLHTSEAIPNQKCDISKYTNSFKYDKGVVKFNDNITVKSNPGYKSSEKINKASGEING